MIDKKRKLIISAIELVKLGEELESAKQTLKELVDRGVPYNSAEMMVALTRCQQLNAQWQDLEQQHLTLRDSLKHH